MSKKLNIYKKDLVTLMVEVVRDQYGLQEPKYEQYLDNLCSNRFIDLKNEHTIQLFRDFVNILPNLIEVIYNINDNGTNPNVTNIVIDGMVDSDTLYEEDFEEVIDTEDTKLMHIDNYIDTILGDCTPEEKIEYLQSIIEKISDEIPYNEEN